MFTIFAVFFKTHTCATSYATLGPHHVARLVLRTDLNGKFGLIEEFVQDAGRFAVRVPGETRLISLKPSNLYESSDPTACLCPACGVGDPTAIASWCPYCGADAETRRKKLREAMPQHPVFVQDVMVLSRWF